MGLDPVSWALIGSAALGAGGSYMASREQRKAQQAQSGAYGQYLPYAHSMMDRAETLQDPGHAYQQYLSQYLRGAFNPQLDPAYQQMIQGVRGATSARGLTASPYGAGLEGRAATHWGMQQRDQQSQALQNYLAGMGGIQNIGSSALEAALAVQGGRGLGQTQPSPWADVSSQAGDIFGMLAKKKWG